MTKDGIHGRLIKFSLISGRIGLLDVAPLWRLRRGTRSRPGAHVQELLQQRHPAFEPGKVDGAIHLENASQH